MPTAPAPERSTRRAIVKLLKTEGATTIVRLAKRLDLTTMAIRQHLHALQRQKLVEHDERPGPIGRPAGHWQLTRTADGLFPDAYAELNVALIDAVGQAFGPDGLKKVLASREARQRADYQQRVSAGSLKARLQQLADVRTSEGYMAEVKADGRDAFVFVENHCPICAAATACKGLCATELDLFRAVLGRDVSVERTEHIVSGDRRCTYRVQKGVRSTAPERKEAGVVLLTHGYGCLLPGARLA